jgi:hypothetical protein
MRKKVTFDELVHYHLPEVNKLVELGQSSLLREVFKAGAINVNEVERGTWRWEPDNGLVWMYAGRFVRREYLERQGLLRHTDDRLIQWLRRVCSNEELNQT